MGRKWKNRFRTFRKYWDLMLELVKRDIKLKYRRSVLGYIWSVLNPLLIMGDVQEEHRELSDLSADRACSV